MVSSTPRPHFIPGKGPVPISQEAGWAPGPVWTGGKSRPHRDSIPDRPARSQSLYRLSYPAHCMNIKFYNFIPHIDHIKHNGDPSLEKKRNSVFYLLLNLKQKSGLTKETEIFRVLKYPVLVCRNLRSLNIVMTTNVLLLLSSSSS